MHLLVIFLIMNHQCMVLNNLNLKSSLQCCYFIPEVHVCVNWRGVTIVIQRPSTATTSHTESCRDGESEAKELLMGLPQLSLLKHNRPSGKMQVSLWPINVTPIWKSAFVLWFPIKPQYFNNLLYKSAHLLVNYHLKITFRIFRNSVIEYHSKLCSGI